MAQRTTLRFLNVSFLLAPSLPLLCALPSICYSTHSYKHTSGHSFLVAAAVQICAMCIQFVVCLHYYTLKHEVPMTASWARIYLFHRHTRQGKRSEYMIYRIMRQPSDSIRMSCTLCIDCRISIRFWAFFRFCFICGCFTFAAALNRAEWNPNVNKITHVRNIKSTKTNLSSELLTHDGHFFDWMVAFDVGTHSFASDFFRFPKKRTDFE